jgi:serine/threonine protein kinase
MAIESSVTGVGKLVKIYMSKNNNFLIYRQHFLNGKPAPNICDYLTERNKPLDINLIRAIAVDLLRTLQYLHSKGIAHLDLQPSNIIVLEDFE